MSKPSRHIPFVHLYLLLTAGITVGIGVVLLFWPDQILQWFIPGATGHFFIRFIGSALVGFATLNILAAETKNRETHQIALWSNFMTLVIATVLSVYGVASHAVAQLGWVLIAEHIVFLTGFSISLYVEYNTPQ